MHVEVSKRAEKRTGAQFICLSRSLSSHLEYKVSSVSCSAAAPFGCVMDGGAGDWKCIAVATTCSGTERVKPCGR